MQKKTVIKVSGYMLLAITVTGLSGCGMLIGKDSYFRDHSVDYVKAKEMKSMKLPEGITMDKGQPVMSIPDVKVVANKNSNPNEIPMLKNPIMQAGNLTYEIVTTPVESTIKSDAGQELLWARILAFLTHEGIALTENNIKSGVIETKWFVPANQPKRGFIYHAYVSLMGKSQDERQQMKLRFGLKPSLQKGFWNIKIDSKQKSVNSAQMTQWKQNNTSKLLQAVRQDFLVYLVEHSGDLVSNDHEGKFNPITMSTMIKDGNGNSVLKLSSGFDTAWNAVNAALKKLHIVVEKANHAAGIFYIALPGADTIDVDKPATSNTFKMLFGNDKSAAKAPVYRLVLAPVSDGVYLSVEKNIDTTAPAKLTKLILQKIQSELS